DAAATYRQAEQQVTQRGAELTKAEQTAQDARAADDAARAAVGSSAADLYRASTTGRYPVLGLDVTDPAGTPDVLTLQAVADDDDEALQGAVVRAERAGD